MREPLKDISRTWQGHFYSVRMLHFTKSQLLLWNKKTTIMQKGKDPAKDILLNPKALSKDNLVL